MTAKLYSCTAIGQAISKLSDMGYECITLEEGTLGYGHIFMLSPDENHYHWIFKEVYLNEWSSAHTVRRTAKISKKYQRLIENAGY